MVRPGQGSAVDSGMSARGRMRAVEDIAASLGLGILQVLLAAAAGAAFAGPLRGGPEVVEGTSWSQQGERRFVQIWSAGATVVSTVRRKDNGV